MANFDKASKIGCHVPRPRQGFSSPDQFMTRSVATAVNRCPTAGLDRDRDRCRDSSCSNLPIKYLQEIEAGKKLHIDAVGDAGTLRVFAR